MCERLSVPAWELSAPERKRNVLDELFEFKIKEKGRNSRINRKRGSNLALEEFLDQNTLELFTWCR